MGLSEMIFELAAAHDALNTPIEGLRDILSLDTLPETRAASQTLLNEMLERQRLLSVAIAALEALVHDGYPTVPTLPAPDVVLLDISNQISTITSAEIYFTPRPHATTLNLSVSPPETKENENA